MGPAAEGFPEATDEVAREGIGLLRGFKPPTAHRTIPKTDVQSLKASRNLTNNVGIVDRGARNSKHPLLVGQAVGTLDTQGRLFVFCVDGRWMRVTIGCWLCALPPSQRTAPL